ncbi:MAG: dihydrofolate reductase family protein [Thermoprotei archaeon]
MRTVLYVACSVDFMIADSSGSVGFIPKRSWIRFTLYAKKKKCVLFGRRTFDMIKSAGELHRLHNTTVMVATRRPLEPADTLLGVVRVQGSPERILAEIEKRGFRSVLLGGGANLNTQFLKAGLLDEMVFDIEPWIIGKGLPVFTGGRQKTRLQLVEARRVSGEVRLRYRVIR